MIVLDTHVLVWWAGGEERQLSEAAKHAIDKEMKGGHIYISSASAWEIAVLVSQGRIGLASDVSGWLQAVSGIAAVEFIPIDNDIAVLSTQLGDDFHKDPADRWIAATSLKLGAPLVTADRKIRDYRKVRTLW